jgi:hypothetical protein
VVDIALPACLIAQLAHNAHDRVRQLRQAVDEAFEVAGFQNVEPVRGDLGAGARGDVVGVSAGLLLVAGCQQHAPSRLSVVKRSGAPDVGGAANEEKGF